MNVNEYRSDSFQVFLKMYYVEDNEIIVLCHVHDFIIGAWPFLVFKLRKLYIKLNASWTQGREENSTNRQRHGRSKI